MYFIYLLIYISEIYYVEILCPNKSEDQIRLIIILNIIMCNGHFALV